MLQPALMEDDAGLTIRACTTADRAAVRPLLVAQLEEHGIPTDPLDAALDGALRDPSRALVLVAQDAQGMIGVAYLSFTWTLEHGGKSAWLEELYVAPPRRCSGVGAKLLDAVLREATDRGCRAVDLEVEAGHARAANLYLRAGFAAHTRARWVRKLAR